MFHFTPRRIEAHVCICFEALKVYKELERLLKLSGCPYSVNEVISVFCWMLLEILRHHSNHEYRNNKTPRSLFTQKLTEVSVFYAFGSILEDSSGVFTVICDRGVKTERSNDNRKATALRCFRAFLCRPGCSSSCSSP